MANPTLAFTPAEPRPAVDGVVFQVTGEVGEGRIIVVKDGKVHARSTVFGLHDTVYGDPGGPFVWGPIYFKEGIYTADLVYLDGEDDGTSMLEYGELTFEVYE